MYRGIGSSSVSAYDIGLRHGVCGRHFGYFFDSFYNKIGIDKAAFLGVTLTSAMPAIQIVPVRHLDEKLFKRKNKDLPVYLKSHIRRIGNAVS